MNLTKSHQSEYSYIYTILVKQPTVGGIYQITKVVYGQVDQENNDAIRKYQR